ncbi:hypothetical protein P3T18_006759 [Paraburkholderia sp. GAS199]
MSTCPLLRAQVSPRRQSRSRTHDNARGWRALSVKLSVWTGWRAMRGLLNAIPDSNDDFGLF